MLRRFLLLLPVLLVIVNSRPIYSQEITLQTLFTMDLRDLASVEFTVASTKPETLTATPAIVSRYDTSELEHLGLRSLKDILSFIPGFNLQDTSLGDTSVMVRGVAEAFNQKVLFLLDDVPYWMPSHSAIPLLGIPISSIESVEVIRGPGAVIYGSNAATAVIKVITKRSGENRLAFSASANNHTNLNLYYRFDLGDKGQLGFAFETQNNDGYPGEHIDAPIPPAYSMPIPPATRGFIDKPEDFTSFSANYRRENLHIGLQTHSSGSNGLAGFASVENQSSLNYEGYLLNLNNSWQLGKTDLKVFADYNEFYLSIPLRNHPLEGGDALFQFDKDGSDNYRWRVGSTAEHTINPNLSVLLGVETEKRSTGNYQILSQPSGSAIATMVPASITMENSLFSQLDFSKGHWRFLLGARFTDNEKSGRSTTPRVAIVYQIDENRSLKLLHSEGFNSPNFVQQLINIPNAIIGHEDLKAEVIRSTELAYSATTEGTLFVANIYYFSATDFIIRNPEADGNHYRNSPAFDRYGFELEYQLQREHWRSFLNLSYNHQGDRSLDHDNTALFAPKLNINLGLFYRLSQSQTLGGSVRYTGPRANASSVALTDINYEHQLGNYLLYATIKNLLDEHVLYPDIQNLSTSHLVPGYEGRRIELGLSFGF